MVSAFRRAIFAAICCAGMVLGGASGTSAAGFSTLLVESDPPIVTIISPPNGIVATSQPAIAFVVADASPGLSECQLDGGAWSACASPFVPGVPLVEGIHVLEVRHTDLHGNVGQATPLAFRVDLPPVVTILAPTAGQVFSVSRPTVNYSVNDPTAATLCSFDHHTYSSCLTAFIAPPLADGAHVLSAMAIDQFGNVGEASVNFVIAAELNPNSAPRARRISFRGSRGGRVRHGRFTYIARIKIKPPARPRRSACTGNVTLRLKPRVRHARTVYKSVKLRRSGKTYCRATARLRVKSRYKRRRATLSAAYAGSSVMRNFRKSTRVKRL